MYDLRIELIDVIDLANDDGAIARYDNRQISILKSYIARSSNDFAVPAAVPAIGRPLHGERIALLP